MMCLYTVTFKYIRIDRALRKELYSVKFTSFFLKYSDKLFAYNFPFLLRLGNTCELIKESVYCININQISIHLVFENLNDLFRLTFSEQSMIYMYANELFSDCFYKQSCNNRTVYTARKRKKDFLIANLSLKLFYLLVNNGICKCFCGYSLHAVRSDI